MGSVSAKLADITILTAEDPRNERLIEVNREILAQGLKNGAVAVHDFTEHASWNKVHFTALETAVTETLAHAAKPFLLFNEDSIQSREDAIDCALRLAHPGDIVIITGKAHEKSLAFGETEFPWNEQQTVERMLNKKAGSKPLKQQK
jgi:UDP-N-acetylmuramoyl-L-alanyl-D-glutamate--2,6-diaminopimelate ligase